MNTIDDLTVYGIVHDVPILQASGIEYLKNLLVENNVRTFLEIGTAIGRTSLMAANLHPEMQVVTIEKDPEMISQAQKNFSTHEGGQRITLITQDALEAEIPDQKYDCIFIDAAKGQYIRFFERYAPYLSENGIIVSDNMNFHGLVQHPERTRNRHTKGLIRRIRDYRQFLETQSEFVTEIIEVGDGIALTRRK